MVISKEIRQQVRKRAKYLCEYCHSSEEASAARFEIDHIQPRSLGGSWRSQPDPQFPGWNCSIIGFVREETGDGTLGVTCGKYGFN